jgi:hypothetical protein
MVAVVVSATVLIAALADALVVVGLALGLVIGVAGLLVLARERDR